MAVKDFAYQSPTGSIFAVLEAGGKTLTATFQPVGKEEFIRLCLGHSDSQFIAKSLLPKIDQDSAVHLKNLEDSKKKTLPDGEEEVVRFPLTRGTRNSFSDGTVRDLSNSPFPSFDP